eukprot:TRINITY_DN6409_c2_g1_i2.p1 TRINITY_DN6409_c2_g1~~TRINITY_DN6409_c2_g1_i2.p1  ORF type:complete len:695 (-),score=174.05 TRINITY_DN6409_c2_g1_i2:491-2575(-)
MCDIVGFQRKSFCDFVFFFSHTPFPFPFPPFPFPFHPFLQYTVPKFIAKYIHHIAGINTFPNYDRAHHMKSQFDSVDVQPKVEAGSNAPRILRSRNGDGQLPLFVLPVCKDGSMPTGSDTPCSSSDAATTLVATITFNGTRGTETTTVNLDLTTAGTCKLCSQWRGFWNVLCSGAAPGQDVVACNLPLKGIRNYSPQTVTYTTKYASGATSATLPYNVKVWGGQLATPASLSAFYGIPTGTKGTAPGNSAAVAEFLGQFYSPEDLKVFLAHNDLPNAIPFVIGPNDPGVPGGEATLDIEYLMGMAPGVPPVFWSVALENAQIEPFHKWMVQVLNNQSAALVHSVSYGDDEIDLTNEQMQRLNQEFMKAGVRGLTILFASGDDGVSDTPVRTNVSECYRFRPSFPPTSPYVTAVGATMWSNKNRALCNQNDHGFDFLCNGLGEIVSDSFTGSGITSGGGFSDIFPMPDYQKAAVEHYLSTFEDSLPPQKFFNKRGRAYPDVSGIGHNFIVRWNMTSIQIDGTSASTPLVASMVALLNDARLNTNAPPMGFMNPWLYTIAAKTPTAFFDVTVGNNRCSAFADHCCEYGYEAVPGFDAAVGLGTPNFHTWKTLVLNPDSPFPSFAGDQRPGKQGMPGPPGPASKLDGSEQGFIFNFSVIVSFLTLAVMLVVVIALAWHRFGSGDGNGTELRDRSGLN